MLSFALQWGLCVFNDSVFAPPPISCVEAVSSLAAPLIAEPPDESGDLLKQAMEEIETSVAEAQEKITEARRDINAKLQARRHGSV